MGARPEQGMFRRTGGGRTLRKVPLAGRETPQRQGPHPVRIHSRQVRLQFLAGRRARAGHHAPNHAGVVPLGQAGVGDGAGHRRAGQGRG